MTEPKRGLMQPHHRDSFIFWRPWLLTPWIGSLRQVTSVDHTSMLCTDSRALMHYPPPQTKNCWGEVHSRIPVLLERERQSENKAGTSRRWAVHRVESSRVVDCRAPAPAAEPTAAEARGEANSARTGPAPAKHALGPGRREHSEADAGLDREGRSELQGLQGIPSLSHRRPARRAVQLRIQGYLRLSTRDVINPLPPSDAVRKQKILF